MKITKIEYDEENGILTVWTDQHTNLGWGFPVDDIVDAADLKAKVKEKVNDFKAEEATKVTNKTRADGFKSLEGSTL